MRKTSPQLMCSGGGWSPVPAVGARRSVGAMLCFSDLRCVVYVVLEVCELRDLRERHEDVIRCFDKEDGAARCRNRRIPELSTVFQSSNEAQQTDRRANINSGCRLETAKAVCKLGLSARNDQSDTPQWSKIWSGEHAQFLT